MKLRTKVLVLTALVVLGAAALWFGVQQARAATCTRTSPTQLVCSGGVYNQLYGQGCSLTVNFSGPNWEFLGVNGDGSLNLLLQGDVPTGNSVTCGGTGGGGGSSSSGGGGGGPVTVPDAGIWLADVCEPYDGFSIYGNQTWDTNADNLGYVISFQAGPSPTGPWTPLGVAGPPWVVNRATLEGVAAAYGLPSYRNLWMISSDRAKAVSVGAEVAARDARMSQLCINPITPLP